MILHCPTKNSLAVLNHKILEANSQVQNVKLGGHQTCLSINRLWHELCDMLRRLIGTTAPGHHDCSIQEGKMGRGSRVVKVSDRGWPYHEFEPSTTKDPPCRAVMHEIFRELKRPPVGVVVGRGGASSGVVHVT
ncbi:uncharacterized protein TNCV_300901 [Trichonephila clavipes]|nr:uncharacterized protein TNCV_300901 [Trichonephila clavipes]